MNQTVNKLAIFFGFFILIVFAVRIVPAQRTAKGKIIVAVTEARVRSAPSLNAKVLGATKLGTVYPIVGQRTGWYNISYNEGYSGWISATIVEPFDEARRGAIYQKLADKYLNREGLDFDTAAGEFRFLSNVQYEVANSNLEGELALKRLIALAAALDAIPLDKLDKDPFSAFAKNNDAEITYSEPAGQYFVRIDRFWDLRSKFAALPIAEEIAWNGSQTSLPGECEGYVPCHLYNIRETTAKYLEFYPNGKHSRESMQNLADYLQYIAEGANGSEQSGYYITPDPDDRAQLESHVSELRAIVSKSSNPLKSKILGFLDTIESGYQAGEENVEGLDEFWNAFRNAVIRKDKNAVAALTKVPLAMPFGQQSVKSKTDFLRRYDQIFFGETDAAKCFAYAKLSIEDGRYGVYCGFKNALNDESNKPIYYYFERSENLWRFVGLDNINE